jgi:two-component system response regulator AtoC
MRTNVSDEIILVVDDEPEVRGYLETALRCEGYGVEIAEDGEEALNLLKIGVPVCALLLDMMIPKLDGLQVLRELRNSGRNLPVIMISGSVSSGIIVEAMRSGADDFLAKPISQESLRRSLTNILGTPIVKPPKVTGPPPSAVLFFGSSPSLRVLQNIVTMVAKSETPVLIQGETGTGKEVLARHLHALSPRAHQPFIKLNCAALPSELVESELFGYERGAFTGAYQRKPGMFELADKGTLLLDEIGDMDVKLQAKLLQVLQDHEFQRLGGKETVRVDVRVIAATHNDLEKSIVAGNFRQDLYYRLNVVSLFAPPLRELREDIVPLTQFLLKKHSADGEAIPEITPTLKQALLRHDWPGNVRELENVVRKLIVFRDPDLIARDLPSRFTRPTLPGAQGLDIRTKPDISPPDPPILEQVTLAKHQFETEAILAALNTTRWNRKKAAVLLKIDYKALLYKMKRLGINGDSNSGYNHTGAAGAGSGPG